MPRNSAEGAAATKVSILDEAGHLISVYGVEGASLAGIAAALDMSKAGVVGPFGSREHLLGEAYDRAVEVFLARVVAPALKADAGVPRLAALIDAWVDYLTNSPFRGGCVMISAAADLDSHDNPLRETVLRSVSGWRGFLGAQIDDARARGHAVPLDTETVVDQLVGLSMTLNQLVQLLRDADGPARVHGAMLHAVGL